MLNKTSIVSLVLTAGFTPYAAHAALLGAAGDYALSGTTVAAQPELAGLVLEDEITSFSFSGAGESLSGTVQNRVVRSDIDGTLDFYWRITVDDTSNGNLLAFRVINFEDTATLNAEWRIDGLGDTQPDTARYFGPGSGAVNFLFEPLEIGAGTDSVFFFLDTDAVNYDRSGQFDLLCAPSNCLSPLYETFAPSAVPVPAAAWLFGSALIGLVGARRKK